MFNRTEQGNEWLYEIRCTALRSGRSPCESSYGGKSDSSVTRKLAS